MRRSYIRTEWLALLLTMSTVFVAGALTTARAAAQVPPLAVEVIGRGPFVAGAPARMNLRIRNVRGRLTARADPYAQVEIEQGKEKDLYVAAVTRLPSLTAPYLLTLSISDGGAPRTQSVQVQVVRGVRPTLSPPTGTIVARERSTLRIPGTNFQPPMAVFIGNVDVSEQTEIVANALVVSALIPEAPANCTAPLRVQNAGRTYSDTVQFNIPIRDGQPVIEDVHGKLIGGETTEVTVEGKRFSPGIRLFGRNGKSPLEISGVAIESERRLKAIVKPPASSARYDVHFLVQNPCSAVSAAGFPVQVQVRQNSQPTTSEKATLSAKP